MDKSEKRRLKKLGKEIVEQRSAELKKALNEANPAPLGSDAWIENYKAGNENEKWLRKKLPLLQKKEWEKMFVVRQDDNPGKAIQQEYKPSRTENGTLKSDVARSYEVTPTTDTFVQCQSCESITSLMPPTEWLYWKQCSCGNAKRFRFLWWHSLLVRDEEQLRFVRLTGKGAARE